MQGHFKLADFGISEVGILKNRYSFSNKYSKDLEIYENENYKECESSEDDEINIKNEKPLEKANDDEDHIAGTANYICPEIIVGDYVEEEGDYWSLGVLLYFIHTKKLPFDSNTTEGIFDNVMSNKIDWNLLLNSKIDKDLIEIVEGFLKFNKEERLSSLKDVKKYKFFKGNQFYLI